ncbi:hypothetical protein [Pseudogemmobacter bohemicus]|nr:hypothetical protein [Pseudogemmobacter bohemicus]
MRTARVTRLQARGLVAGLLLFSLCLLVAGAAFAHAVTLGDQGYIQEVTG